MRFIKEDMHIINLLDLNKDDISKITTNKGYPGYRAGQIYKWLYRGIHDISSMTDLSEALRLELSSEYGIILPEAVSKQVSETDGTIKYLMALGDGNIIESVLMKYDYGYSACISSQAGCRMGCLFCASTGAGFIRSLTAGEMTGQILAMQEDSGQKAGNVVIMGIGEPFDNYENTIKFLRNANDPDGLGLGYRKLTVSTCGLVPGILRFAREGIPVNLSVSLHAAEDSKRSFLMPVNRSYSIDKIIEACKIYTKATGRRITFEYAMIKGVNDSISDASGLAALLRGLLCHVNIIRLNDVEGTGLRKTDRENIMRFRSIIADAGITVTVRRELGTDIEAACGQLRRKTTGKY